MYYNTTNLAGPELAKASGQAVKQDEIILELYQNPLYSKGLTPSEVWQMLRERWPITSVRRSINTLTRKEYLEKTDIKRTGYYRRKEYVWKVFS